MVANNLFRAVNGTQANGGGLDGSDRAQRTNGSHYYTALETCGGHASGGWQLPPCATMLPAALAELDGFYAQDCVSRPTCGAAPFNNSVVVNVAQPPWNGTIWSGPAEPVPALVADNLLGDPHYASSDPDSALDWAFAPNSPAWALGFQPIPSELWGPDWLDPGAGGPGWRAVVRALVPWAACPPPLSTPSPPIGCPGGSASPLCSDSTKFADDSRPHIDLKCTVPTWA
jgi:hypothetical protein